MLPLDPRFPVSSFLVPRRSLQNRQKIICVGFFGFEVMAQGFGVALKSLRVLPESRGISEAVPMLNMSARMALA